MSNTLRQIKLILYRLKRNYGVPIQIYTPTTSTSNILTGVVTRVYKIVAVPKAIVLSGDQIRTFTYDLSYIATNRNFTYGGFFDRTLRLFILENEVTSDDHIIYDNKRYEVKEVTTIPEGSGYVVLGNEIAEAAEFEVHEVVITQLLGVTQNAS